MSKKLIITGNASVYFSKIIEVDDDEYKEIIDDEDRLGCQIDVDDMFEILDISYIEAEVIQQR
ncbi:hypothetical protein [Photorhabdus hindustanensis]|uniref:Uncharacterized protein n=1 Tax=Photorhabdus hindustanensis TaxID=2918802 RepID=A0A2S8PV68_9GAMM|nr:hypothetical protein [Photorhabdus hindustanensis]PQQ22779.1 hypothetical protein C6H66_22090 [Photorhabdus hindustanensis]